MRLALIAFFTLFSTGLMAQDLEEVNALIKKYKIAAERPKSCPLHSDKFSDLLAKTESIKGVFKDNCLQKDTAKLNEILNSVKDIQDELKKRDIIEKPIDTSAIINIINGNNATADSGTAAAAAAPAAASTTTTTTTTTGSTETLSGIKFSTLFSNVTTMLKRNQCNLDDGRVLEKTADLIYDATQLGLVSGNEMGILVAGGGFIVSSALRLIDMIFKQRFDFEKNTDRQSFIKLNCTFYDVRRDLEAQGALEVENYTNREDLKDVKELITQITGSIKLMEQEKTDQNKVLESMDQATLVALVGDVSVFKKNLLRAKTYLSNGIVDSPATPIDTQKLLMISSIAQDYDLLLSGLNNYRLLKISSIPMLDDLFLQDLQKFDQLDVNFQSLLKMSAKEFNDNLRAKILFHVTRILNDIAAKEEIASTRNLEAKKVKVAELQKKQELYALKLSELKKIEERLGRVVSPKEYSGTDDGSDNMVSMLENYNEISNQIYGEWGEKFLKFTSHRSFDEAKSFKDRFDRFNKKYDMQTKGFEVDKSSAYYICQDIQKIRVSYKYADSLVQEGYDFIITNKDLFHTDSRNYYNRDLDEQRYNGSSPIEKIQRHYKSTILALRKIKKEEISQDDEERYLSRTFMGSSYLGRSMLDVSEVKKIARDMQDKFEKLNCQKVLVEDLN